MNVNIGGVQMDGNEFIDIKPIWNDPVDLEIIRSMERMRDELNKLLFIPFDVLIGNVRSEKHVDLHHC